MNDQLDIFATRMLPEEAAVWKAVSQYQGKQNAVKVSAIAFQTRFDERTVRDIVSHLVIRHGKMIGSSTSRPAGLYVITDPEELKAHVDSLKHRGIMCLVRAAALNKSSVEEIFGQARLELEAPISQGYGAGTGTEG